MNVRRGDVVDVDLGGPNDDTRGHEMYKERPAVVIQNDVGNERSATTIVAPIFDGASNYPFHVTLPASTPGRHKESHAALDQIRTVDIQKRVLRVHGSVSATLLGQIDTAIDISLGL